jgi:hypothetical protein
VAESTIDAGFLFAMAIHAATHGKVGLASELGSRRHGTVTCFAGIAGPDMRAVAEVDEAGDFINPYPFDLVIVLSRVAAATHGGRGKCHSLAGVGILMACGAFQLHIACVHFMTVWNRLLLSASGRRQQDKQAFQRLPVLIRAFYR